MLPDHDEMEELKKNQTFTTDIVSWSADGAGVCRISGRAVFVPGAIPGESWRVRIVKVKAGAVYGRGEERLSDAPCRRVPDCPVFGKCGGCVLRHVSYDAELLFKLQRVNEAYRRIGGLELQAGEIIGAERTEGYRNKAIYAIGPGPARGFYRARSHDIISIARCLLHPPSFDRVVEAVCLWMKRFDIPAYDEATGKGLVRRVFLRSGSRSGELLAVVVSACGFAQKTSALVSDLRAAAPELAGILLNINKTPGNTVLGRDFYLLWGKNSLTDTLCGLTFELSPQSFYQVNPAQAEKLYERAVEWAAPSGSGTVLDLYCGAGTISLCLARKAGKVIGAEIVPEAVENARRNARRNKIDNAEFICADASQAAQEMARRGVRPEAVVIDPPRKGLAEETIAAIAEMSPQRAVYVSCDPATQARDLKRFAEAGYTAVRAVAVDMFPRTAHVETVVLLSKLHAEQHIEVDLSLDELDATSAETKATYDEITAWVWEHHHLKVSNLYISQVKRKCGIIERECYNKPKSENPRVPVCPKEKEDAIMEALRWFRMII